MIRSMSSRVMRRRTLAQRLSRSSSEKTLLLHSGVHSRTQGLTSVMTCAAVLPERSRGAFLWCVLRGVPHVTQRVDLAAFGAGAVLCILVVFAHRILLGTPEIFEAHLAAAIMHLVKHRHAFPAI